MARPSLPNASLLLALRSRFRMGIRRRTMRSGRVLMSLRRVLVRLGIVLVMVLGRRVMRLCCSLVVLRCLLVCFLRHRYFLSWPLAVCAAEALPRARSTEALCNANRTLRLPCKLCPPPRNKFRAAPRHLPRHVPRPSSPRYFREKNSTLRLPTSHLSRRE